MPKNRLFAKCALPFLFMCGLTVAAAGAGFTRSGHEANVPHSEPTPSTPNQSGMKVNNDYASPETGTAPKIGDRMPDGTIYAGTSPDTGKAMYTTPADMPLTYTFNQAQTYAEKLAAHGHRDWRVPTRRELNLLFENRGAIGGFNTSGLHPTGWYWSSSKHYSLAWGQRFSDGGTYNDDKSLASSVQC